MDIGALDPAAYDGRIDHLDCYRLDQVDLAGYQGLIIAGMVDQEYLLRHRDRIAAYLAGGGVLVFGGHLHRDWLPGCSPFVPLPHPTLAAYRVAEVAEHPLFDGLGPDELTFRRGVAGFFARGHHPPPPGVEVLVRLGGGEPAIYLDRVSTAGTVLVQATSDPLTGDGRRLVDWILAEASANHSAGHAGTDHSAGRTGADQSAGPSGADQAGADRTGAGHSANRASASYTTTGDLHTVTAGAPPPAGRGLAAVYGGSAWHHRALTEPKYARHLTGGLLYLPDLADTDLTGHPGLLIPERLHRGLLTRAAPRILELLDAGGTVAAFAGGEPVPEFLPGVRWQHRPTNFWWWLEPGADLGLRTPVPEHPLFERLAMRDCTWHYHGVLDPPDGAEVLVTLPGGEALLYVDRVSTPGTLVVSTLDPLSHYGGYFMPATERFLDGFLPWLAGEVGTRRAVTVE
jgi:hypothetical protein